MRRSFITDIEECKRLWEGLIRPKNVSDLWEFRLCFQRNFNCLPSFLLLEDGKGIAGMIPLSYLKEEEMFVFFPGETWRGKTWLERTPIYLRDRGSLPDILALCPEKSHLRYMKVPEELIFPLLDVDETGYVLYPPTLGFDIALYRMRFSNRKFKHILKTVGSLMDADGSFRFNRLEDFDLLVDMNIQNFGSDSYLYDYRFRESFRDIMHFLHRGGWLRMVSLQINGKTAAVDIGALYQGTYTVFLGGADREVPGIAKAINMQHIEFACNERISKVDFLCGDFHWKKLWHLDPEPLYRFVSPALSSEDAGRPGTTNTSVCFLNQEGAVSCGMTR